MSGITNQVGIGEAFAHAGSKRKIDETYTPPQQLNAINKMQSASASALQQQEQRREELSSKRLKVNPNLLNNNQRSPMNSLTNNQGNSAAASYQSVATTAFSGSQSGSGSAGSTGTAGSQMLDDPSRQLPFAMQTSATAAPDATEADPNSMQLLTTRTTNQIAITCLEMQASRKTCDAIGQILSSLAVNSAGTSLRELDGIILKLAAVAEKTKCAAEANVRAAEANVRAAEATKLAAEANVLAAKILYDTSLISANSARTEPSFYDVLPPELQTLTLSYISLQERDRMLDQVDSRLDPIINNCKMLENEARFAAIEATYIARSPELKRISIEIQKRVGEIEKKVGPLKASQKVWLLQVHLACCYCTQPALQSSDFYDHFQKRMICTEASFLNNLSELLILKDDPQKNDNELKIAFEILNIISNLTLLKYYESFNGFGMFRDPFLIDISVLCKNLKKINGVEIHPHTILNQRDLTSLSLRGEIFNKSYELDLRDCIGLCSITFVSSGGSTILPTIKLPEHYIQKKYIIQISIFDSTTIGFINALKQWKNKEKFENIIDVTCFDMRELSTSF